MARRQVRGPTQVAWDASAAIWISKERRTSDGWY
jgi:hypothetical protein